jgi:hypothetical protein
MDDLNQILNAFPRTFTLSEVVSRFDWPSQRARQAIVNGQQVDIVRILVDHRGDDNRFATYENARWRQQWLTRPWRQYG